jgi:hypothetical protein
MKTFSKHVLDLVTCSLQINTAFGSGKQNISRLLFNFFFVVLKKIEMRSLHKYGKRESKVTLLQLYFHHENWENFAWHGLQN